jgi:hypothetical protein
MRIIIFANGNLPNLEKARALSAPMTSSSARTAAHVMPSQWESFPTLIIGDHGFITFVLSTFNLQR